MVTTLALVASGGGSPVATFVKSRQNRDIATHGQRRPARPSQGEIHAYLPDSTVFFLGAEDGLV